MFGTTFGSQTAREHVECPNPPTDTPSDLSWYWRRDAHALLSAASWDGSVRIWEVQTQAPLQATPFQDSNVNTQSGTRVPPSQTTPDGGTPTITQVVPKAMFQNPAPVLTLHFYGEAIFTGTADKKVMMYNVATQQNTQIGQHAAPVCKVLFNEKKQLVCSVGWDDTIFWWDTRSPQPVGQFKVPANVWEADMNSDVLVVLTGGKRVYVYDINNMNGTPLIFSSDQLHHPPRKIRLFPDNIGFVLSGSEGRCRISHILQDRVKDDFNFRCHRLGTNGQPVIGNTNAASSVKCYSVNGLDFNPLYGTLMTAGAEGYFSTWDKQARTKLYTSSAKGLPINCCKFDPSGRMIALGLGYDWSMGAQGKPAANENKVLVVPVFDQWIHNRVKK
eukprot:Gregarina_sp_Pseudo_9__2829@NODE_305_length_3209_cov_56_840379_g286_i0_p2_GENE_NODE_305_length_3209_cov_56_840379_g286_i0NODE_305_length_3209_cov_56_840379_g286_i0_p2_ORF_typecomplete_len388_score8_76ANAPC4_WD40/PF12894_7/0_012ANAPC4_WD40/PF12894_7/6_6e05ANAPC4_WD40/PF12894_7/0_019ANAPC4_WD40/PF12894_7/0_66WD40/PF00400_32/0_19WD40/PF00400_32/1_4e03WD40/PF00400_32/0_41WD40/PF00400_32/4_7e03WD40/PF00400_32/88WD40/PF00400_32/0_79WD40_like/PF17005_5/3e02WD40_like/PF17005_5/1_6e07WD40_like/PF17005_5/